MRMMNPRWNPYVLAVAVAPCLALATTTATGQVTCPTPPNLVDVEVRAQVEFDPSTDLYTYRYELFNRPGSQQDVRRLALDFAAPISDVASPAGWKESYFKGRDTIHWYAFANAPRPPGEPDTGTVQGGVAQVEPGAVLDGFSFRSPRPPGPVLYYVLGFAPPTPAASEEEAEEILEQCPEIAANFFELAVQGTTQGPVNFVAVAIDVKPGSSINSIRADSRGVIPVAVLTSGSFDAADVDPATVSFGPGGAAPVHAASHQEDVDGDGDIDRVFHFSTFDSGLACGDTTATLTGATFAGTPIQGSDAVRILGHGCGSPPS